MREARCAHKQSPTQCKICKRSAQEEAGNAFLSARLRGLPDLEGDSSAQQAALSIRERFVDCLGELRTLSQRLAGLPLHYQPLLGADPAFLGVLSQELLLLAERGDALLQEEVRAGFWVQHQQGQSTGTELTANQRTVALLGIPRLQEVSRYQPLASRAEYKANGPRKNAEERFYRRALPHTVQRLLEWLIDGPTIARWQEEKEAKRREQERQRQAQQKKKRGGARAGAGRPKGEATRVLSLRIPEPLYAELAQQARAAEQPLSLFIEAWLQDKVRA